MSSSGISTKSVRNLEKPKPLRLSAGSRSSRPASLSSPLEPSPHVPSSPHPHRLSTGPSSVLELMNLLDKVSTALSNSTYDSTLTNNIDLLYPQMKLYGSQIDASYQTEVDNAFVPLRNGTVCDRLDEGTRLKLLHLVELRSAGWKSLHTDYYAQGIAKVNDLELSSSMSSHSVDSLLSPISPLPPSTAPPVLSPGELVKSSGKYPKPTKIPGKNYCKDEVVIRNADSGKVMGIKGRRVHMIEELSETIISFQRVHPGARERNVQITGPNPDNIVHATQLIDETIRKNMSPVRELGLQDSTLLDSNSSCNSSQSDDSGLKLQQPDECSLDMPQYKHFISFGHGRHITIMGNDYSLVNNVVVLVVGNKFSLVGCGPTPPPFSSPAHLDEDPPAYTPPIKSFSPISPIAPPSPYSYLMDLPPPLESPLPPPSVESKSKLSRSKSDASVKPLLLSSNSSSSLTHKLTRTYSRDFLIMCSKSPLSQKKPPELVYIELNYSEIRKPVQDDLHAFVTQTLVPCRSKNTKFLYVL